MEEISIITQHNYIYKKLFFMHFLSAEMARDSNPDDIIIMVFCEYLFGWFNIK